MSDEARKRRTTIFGTPWGEEPAESRFRRGRRRRRNEDKPHRPGRLFTVFKALVLLILMGVTAYGILVEGGYLETRWLPMALGAFALVVITLFVRGFYSDVPRAGWLLVVTLVVLVAVKGLSMTWTLSQAQTILEVVRSSMYLAFFLLALAALSSERQIAPMMDLAVLIVAGLAGYGLLQKIAPVEYPVLSLDGVRVDSTLGYSNTTAMVLGMGTALALARMTSSKSFLLRAFYSAFLLAFLATLYLTVSRGGIGSLALGLAVFFVVSEKRLQSFANLVLVAIPLGWLLWRMRHLPGLLTVGSSDERRIYDGMIFRNDLLIALGVAFVLGLVYTFLVRRYELMPDGRKVLGGLVFTGAALAIIAGVAFVFVHYGGPGKALAVLSGNPDATSNAAQRLTSLSVGFRADYWSVAWEYWKAHPLTGSGAGTFSYVWNEYRPVNTGVQQVHNVYLEQGVETGVFAFLALLAFAIGLIGYTFWAAWRSTGQRSVLLGGLSAAVVVYLVSSALEWHWYIPPSTTFFFIIAGMGAKYAGTPRWSAPSDEDETGPIKPRTQGDRV